ncbi:MAG: D-2-hydroxyacid dehydrogenase [Halanaerobiales bacterium]
MKLLVTIDLKEKYMEMIRDAFPEILTVKALDPARQVEEIIDTDFLVTGFKPDLELFKKGERLQVIQTWSAGVDKYMEEEVLQNLKARGIKLISMSGIHGDPIAEHVMGLIINYSRRLYDFYEAQKERKWLRLDVGQLAGKTMVIVGTGSIGREIARRAKAFRMRTIGVKRNIEGKIDYIDELYSNAQLEIALKQGDYIVIALPLTEETRGFIGRKEFAVMKETAFFVNIARGEVVDEGALIEALKEGRIAGAALDVFTEEPLSPDSPFYDLENVYITPHISAAHPDYNLKAVRLFIENLKSYLENREIKNLVDYNRGY